MFNLLYKIFIKDYKNLDDIKVRTRYGIFAGIFGIVTNILIALLKLIFGLLTFSIALISDGVNNLNDSLSSIITIVGFKVSSKEADKDHPFGHERYEYILSLIISLIIIVVGVSFLKDSIIQLYELLKYNTTNLIIDNYLIIIIILIFSILIKLFQFFLYNSIEKRIHSDAIRMDKKDSFNDIITTTGVLITIILYQTTNNRINLDSLMGILISSYIIISGILSTKDVIQPLIGTNPTKEEINKIMDMIKAYPNVLGVHDLIIHNYGPKVSFVTVHIEIDATLSVLEGHNIIDQIEKDFLEKYKINLTIHMDPYQRDELANKLIDITNSVLNEINPNITFHDFQYHKDPYFIHFDLVINDNNIDLNNLKKELKNAYFELLNSDVKIDIIIDKYHNTYYDEE